MEIKEIPLELIEIHENVRKEYNDIEELADSIKSQGLLSPVIVEPKKDGKYILIAGHRRLKACQLLKYEIIPAVIKSIDNVKLTQLIENVQRSDLTKYESSKAVAEILDKTGLSQPKLAKQLGKSDTWVYDRKCYYDIMTYIDSENTLDIPFMTARCIHAQLPEYWDILVNELSKNVYRQTYEIRKDIDKSIAKHKGRKVKSKSRMTEKTTLDLNKIYLIRKKFPITQLSDLRFTMTFTSERQAIDVMHILKKLGGEIL